MLKKRVIVCLDVKAGKVTKGIKFQNNKEIGDPVELAKKYEKEGADELVFYDITASSERRSIMLEIVSKIAAQIFIPFSVGGGIGSVEDMRMLLLNGAEKVSVNSLAVLTPSIINDGAKSFGSQCIVLGIDVFRNSQMPSGYETVIRGGREKTGKDALAWVKEAVDRGVGEIVVNSIDADGMKTGYDCVITKLVSEAVSVPVVASGGAGTPSHLREVLEEGRASAALIASMVHYGDYTVSEIKQYLLAHAIAIRTDY